MIEVPEDVIIPPPAIRAIVLKTAQYVSRNGSEFEEKLKQQSQSSKFTFLDPKDVYHGYYQFLLEDPDELLKEEEKDTALATKIKELEPLPPLNFTVSLPVISSKDLDTLKLVAQFVAVNGEDYKQAIRNKYHDQLLRFGFMESTHSLNPLFERYVDQYRLVLSKDFELIPTEQLLERAYKRAEYEVTQKENTEKQERQVEEEKLRFARVDWTDFVIVETIEFTEVDGITELEQPVTIQQLQLKSLDEKSKQVTAISLPQATNETEKITTPTTVPGMKIREFGATRIKSTQSKEKLIQCPITGKMIPEQNFQRHMDILLRDPKYKEEKAKYEAKIKNTNLNPEEAAANLKALLKPVKHDQSNKRQRVVWDGYQSSVDFVTNKNQATEDEMEEFKRKQKEPLIGPTKP